MMIESRLRAARTMREADRAGVPVWLRPLEKGPYPPMLIVATPATVAVTERHR